MKDTSTNDVPKNVNIEDETTSRSSSLSEGNVSDRDETKNSGSAASLEKQEDLKTDKLQNAEKKTVQRKRYLHEEP